MDCAMGIVFDGKMGCMAIWVNYFNDRFLLYKLHVDCSFLISIFIPLLFFTENPCKLPLFQPKKLFQPI